MVFCATLHDTHGKYVLEALEAGKAVFVEKPLAISREEMSEINKSVVAYNGQVMIGFNRRFSKSFTIIDEFFKNRQEPMSISYRVNAGRLPKSHWVYLPEQGGGRVVGEACHFIDCMVFLTKSLPKKIYAEQLSASNAEVFNGDNVLITIKFEDGSVGVLEYLANGDSSVSKEYCEVFCEGSAAIMDNFTSLSLARNGKTKKQTLDGKKGHNEEVAATVEAVRKGLPMPIPYNELRAVTEATFAANESLALGLPIEI
jgi:polar amino acid transport system substrate-binding protein